MFCSTMLGQLAHGHLRHRGEPADVDAEVRNLLIRGGLRPLDKDDRGHEEDEERHRERTHAG